MTIQYDFDSSPIRPGVVRQFRLLSTSPTKVQIKCFVDTPLPPDYRPCAECGSYSLSFMQTIDVVASSRIFAINSGSLHITITNIDGDIESIQVPVWPG